MSQGELEQLLVRESRNAGRVALEGSMLRDVGVQRRDVEARFGVHATRDVRHRDDARALACNSLRSDAADIAEALHRDVPPQRVPSEALARSLDHHDDAAPRWPRATTDPPIEIGLPVTISGTRSPSCIEYVSIIQAMVCSLVPMSGAGMSRSGPMIGASSAVKRRVIRSNSPRDSFARVDGAHRPSHRRTAGPGARTSRSSTSPARHLAEVDAGW